MGEKSINTAVILAAGRGTRLRPYTNEIPKGFVEVGEETLIERSTRLLNEHGIDNIIIGTGHLHEQYEQLAKSRGWSTFFNQQYAVTDSFDTLIQAAALVKDDFLLLESDLLYDPQAIQALLADNAPDCILTSGFTKSGDEVYAETKDGRLVNLSKNKDDLKQISAELVGIWKVSLKLFQALLDLSEDDEASKDGGYEFILTRLSAKFP
ncbi:MAG: phosphocholine cytidylyltransferase family protein, partial [Cyclobacteriaceae bacterium]|nr:phosphocholine cytidylyltransferase family protein [Cyclobacteriaceae bacterium HetDA_MAG_MS6]